MIHPDFTDEALETESS